ncbi:hypothetical protein K493DRAFT_313775 [Basidiobolus meristosporus CBS 931.73]|uniref:BHLH domain-containing protein n=1 Tax=Basidiobolus meristosporus CBS 931.73 TaxID=1314790 RepID=A0A1Y1YJH8_9FUNG|nr:hypothetical protein K493DRAFT_313775 [Basidiobolus meristosporus CBS 931.73]|eukprot:ORX98159.1 hypothetical protein K493DRAFT_313775 [Basidiobolus meristosporus CBS 931.73]
MDAEQAPQPMNVTESSAINTNGALDIPSFNSFGAPRTARLPSAPSIMTHVDVNNFSSPEDNPLRTERLPSAPSIVTNTLKVPGHLPQGSSSTTTATKRVSNRKLRAYSFDDSIREFCPDKLYQTKDNRKRESYMVHGVNILNRDDVDSSTAINRLQKRREQHNRVERRRRDLINTSIEELSEIVPLAQLEGVKFARGNVLRLTIDYIKELQQEIQSLRLENENLRNSSTAQIPRLDPTKRPPTIVINQPGNLPVNTTFPSPSSAGWESEIRTPTDGQDFSSPIGPNHSGQLISPITSSPFPSPFHSPTHSPIHPSSPINENPMALPHPALPEITLTTASSLASSPVPLHGSVPSSPIPTSPSSPLPLQISSWQPFSNTGRNT